jgi:antirestriction protein ArdC
LEKLMKKKTSEKKRREQDAQALSRAIHNAAPTNYAAIYQGFSAKGIAMEEIRPRENVFTFQAWRALGRCVRRGEHGVRVVTIIAVKRRDENGRQSAGTMPWSTTVFHISQTDEIKSERAEPARVQPDMENQHPQIARDAVK